MFWIITAISALTFVSIGFLWIVGVYVYMKIIDKRYGNDDEG